MLTQNMLYLSSAGTSCPAFLKAQADVQVLPLYALEDLSPAQLAQLAVLLIPAHTDQRFLQTQQAKLETWLLNGGTMVFNGHVAHPFLSYLQAYQPQSAPGLAGLQVHRGPEHPIFNGVQSEHLTFRRGVAGFYARGCNPPFADAQVLNTLGDNHLPIDWLLTLPGGGRLLVHAGNDIWMHAQDADSSARIAPQLLDWLRAGAADHDRVTPARALAEPEPALNDAQAANAGTSKLISTAPTTPSKLSRTAKAHRPIIAALDAGTYYHHRSLNTPEWKDCIDYSVYIRELNEQALQACDIFIVSCTSPVASLVAHQAVFERFLAQGKTLVVLGANHPQQWLAHVRQVESPVNFWWWLTPGADSGLRIAAPEHSLFQHLTLEDATWHQHGAHLVPPGAVSLIDKVNVGSVLYDDCVSTPGRLIVSSLDPMYHHGSYFMPASTRFLKSFLPWLKQQ